jgi:uracil-DNA glycosylase family 4
MTSLETIAHDIRACTLCPLARSRTNAVPGEGPASARLMFVGEAPGQAEDAQGRPFVGRAGQVLNQALLFAGIERSEVFITNVVKCRPPNNRVPTKNEIDSCITAHLHRQIQSIEPEIICLLGGTAVKALLGVDRLEAVRGRIIIIEKNRKYFVTYHPAGAGRNPAWHEAFQGDLKKLNALLTNKG